MLQDNRGLVHYLLMWPTHLFLFPLKLFFNCCCYKKFIGGLLICPCFNKTGYDLKFDITVLLILCLLLFLVEFVVAF